MQAEARPEPERGLASSLPDCDRELVAAVLRKDRKATAEFVERFADGVYRYLVARLFPRPDRADDLFQETFLAAWEHLAKYRGESTLESWLRGIARHKVEDYYRSRLREAEPLDEPSYSWPKGGDEEPPYIARLDDEWRRQKIWEVLRRLPESYALALVWRYWEKRPAKEMAEMSGKTEKAVERLLARARALFRERWQGE